MLGLRYKGYNQHSIITIPRGLFDTEECSRLVFFGLNDHSPVQKYLYITYPHKCLFINSFHCFYFVQALGKIYYSKDCAMLSCYEASFFGIPL